MLTIKTSDHISTSRTIKGYRSGRHATGIFVPYIDLARVELEKKRLAIRKAKRLWFAGQGRSIPRRAS